MTGTALWVTVVVGSVGCYVLKLAGLSVPAAWVERPWVTRVVEVVPAALLVSPTRGGFVAGHVQDTEWGLSLLMHRYRE